MIFRQLTHDDLGCASYLVGDEDADVAAVVDPKLDIDEYLRPARYLGVRIEHVPETHNHADHVSGHGRLVAATGAIDTARSDEPWAVLTGDTLFVGDIARPDLAVDKEEGARGIFHSLKDRLMSPPDTTEVWPGHLGGSLCGGPRMDLKVSSTIGFERANQALLQVTDEDEFVMETTSTLGPQPPNFENIVALNRGQLVKKTVEAHPLTPRQVQQAQADGAVVIDVRTELQFDEAHIPAALSITARRARFGSTLAWLAKPEQSIMLVGRDDDDAVEAVVLAAAVGLRNIAGYLAGGMTSWREDKLDVDRVERMTVPELHERWARDGGGLQLLDVREQSEWDAAHIPGSVHRPYHDIHALPDGIDPAKPVAAICSSGQRSAVAASLVKRFGADEVIHVVEGGFPLWEREGWPTEPPQPSGS